MINAFLNPWMLAGLAGVLLPVIAHLLSRKKYDLVEWGAMQFLELDPSAKRKFRLEELLLMALRMVLVALIALALARPWMIGGWLGWFVSTQSRDLVLIVDGSGSMGWSVGEAAPADRARQTLHQLLGELRPGDTYQLIDARESPLVLLPEATRDITRIRDLVKELPPPGGVADLPAAINRALQLLTAGTNLQREIVVFTDLQSHGWKPDDANLWSRLDDIRGQTEIVPRIWVIDCAADELGKAANFTVERVQLSRELAVTGLPVKISTRIKYAGGDVPVTRKIHFEIDQQRLTERTLQLKLTPNGETSVEFEYRFDVTASHVMSVVIDDDALASDNRSDAVVIVADSLQVLLVDGDVKLDRAKSETYFANAALAAGDEHKPWIRAQVVLPEEISADRLSSVAIVVLSNVPKLSAAGITALREFILSGKAVLFTLGSNVDKQTYHELFASGLQPLLPCRLQSLVGDDAPEKRGVRVQSSSLELPWLKAFRTDQGGSLADARWSRWWKVVIDSQQTPAELPESAPSKPVALDGAEGLGEPVVEIRLTTGDPLLITRRLGRGVTGLLTSSLDADWNTLPAKQDYVPFLHELLFSLAGSGAARNVDVGAPLIVEIPRELNVEEYQFLNPVNKPQPAEKVLDEFRATARLRAATIPGVYRFLRKSGDGQRTEYFAVNFDRGESDLTPLAPEERERLGENGRMTFVSDLPELRQNMFSDGSRLEIWWLVLYLFLLGLACEAWMTRRMVQGGFATGP